MSSFNGKRSVPKALADSPITDTSQVNDCFSRSSYGPRKLLFFPKKLNLWMHKGK